MTLVDTETGEVIESLDAVEAERLSSRISLRLDTIADNYEVVVPLIREAVERRAWSALGYRPPGEYAADRFGGALGRLGTEFRQAVVRELSSLGMSTRAIAPVVQASQATVRRDLAPESYDSPETPAPLPEGEADRGAGQASEGEVTPAAPPVATVETATPRPPVTGLDGKVYALKPRAPRPPKPVLAGEAAEYENAEQASKALARAISKLLEFQHPNMREGMRRYWSMASIEVPPTPRRDVTSEQMRVAAHGLLSLADEWDDD